MFYVGAAPPHREPCLPICFPLKPKPGSKDLAFYPAVRDVSIENSECLARLICDARQPIKPQNPLQNVSLSANWSWRAVVAVLVMSPAAGL